MNQFKRVRMFGAFALALAMALTWQQSSGAKASDEPVWQAPLEAPIQLVRPYRQPNSDYSAGHRGVDFQVQIGQAIFSPTDSKVRFNQNLVDRPVLSLETKAGEILEFEPACGSLPVGAQIHAGDAIGYVCQASSGYVQHCSKMTCLHFALRTSRGYLSPIVRYGALSPSVLLPFL
jgi:murein DD-endopeptidase MepM/ murein hydrolase activator NlpD